MTTPADFFVTGEGPFTTVYLLHSLTDAAREWVAEHLPEDAQRLGNAIAVEHRYIGDIVCGARNDGLAVR
jgi:predicted thioesterase